MERRRSTKAGMARVLETVPLFMACSRRERSLVAGIAEEICSAAGEVICCAGDDDVALSVILDGTVEVLVDGQPRRRLGAGDFFGEIALIHGRPRTATVVAITNVRLLSVPGWSFEALLRNHPAIAVKMLQEVTRRLVDV